VEGRKGKGEKEKRAEGKKEKREKREKKRSSRTVPSLLFSTRENALRVKEKVALQAQSFSSVERRTLRKRERERERGEREKFEKKGSDEKEKRSVIVQRLRWILAKEICAQLKIYRD
jgi:hypothetical protein